VIAETHEGLRGNLLAPISINEHGYEACGSGHSVWTGTRADGTWDSENCLDWTTDSDTYRGANGSACSTDRWSYSDNDYNCDEELVFFCFEQ
jgi:hypothetical protein